jgi:hypothetical protein
VNGFGSDTADSRCNLDSPDGVTFTMLRLKGELWAFRCLKAGYESGIVRIKMEEDCALEHLGVRRARRL